MPTYRTIGSDPLDAGRPEESAALIWAMPAAPALAATAAVDPALAGGSLTLLGGDLGTGTAWIRGVGGRLGFIAPDGSVVELGSIVAIDGSRDRLEHRWLSIAGWTLAVGSVAGSLGGLLAGGVRWLRPARMIVDVRLRDGRRFIAGSDRPTVSALQALAQSAPGD